MKPALSIESLRIGYDDHILLDNLNLQVQGGELVCLMGANGAGKSTLLRALSSLQPPLNGTIAIDAISIYQMSAREKAKLISIVLTDQWDLGYLRVHELVAMGRYPHTGWRGHIQGRDRDMVNQALQTTGLNDLADRMVRELSDGQKQKTLIARALAQDGPIMILDEPLIHLDVANKWEVMNLLKHTAHSLNKVMIMATHEMELSIQMADKLWLITRDGQVAVGCPEDLMIQGLFSAAFDSENYQFHYGQINYQHQNDGASIQVVGNDDLAAWTGKALMRKGYNAITSDSDIRVRVVQDKDIRKWQLEVGDNLLVCESIEMLLDTLETQEF